MAKINNLSAMLLESVQKYGQKTLFIGEGFTKTYKDFYEDVQRLSSYFIGNDLIGKKIGIYASNSYNWLLLFFAVATDIGTIVPLDKELPEKELVLSARRIGLDYIFYDDSTKDRTGRLPKIIQIKHIDTINDILEQAPNRIINKTPKRECAALFLTSGTTSKSKIVMLSEKNLVSCAYSSAAAFKLKTTDRYYTILPLHHTLTLMCAVLVPITNGCSICFCKNIKDMQKEMCFYRPTALVVVPRLLEYIMNNIKLTARKTHKEKALQKLIIVSRLFRTLHIDIRKPIFSSVHAKFGGKVRMIACGGAELDQRVFSFLDDLGFNIYQGYGLTESSPILTIRGMFVKSKIGVGRPLNGVHLKITDPDVTGVGEIIAKAPQVMLGYYDDKAATEEVLKNGWLYTGDLGRIRADGNLEVVGRKKNVIVTSNGKNIYPEELETLINYSDIVKESIVNGVQKKSGLQIIATIVPEDKNRKDKSLDSKINRLIKDINAELPDYKRINKYVIKKDEFEKTTTLKIKRGEK